MASYEKSVKGTWSVRFRTVENFLPRQRRLGGFKTKREAEQAYLNYKNEYDKTINSGLTKDATTLTFYALYEEYCEFQKNRIKQSSFFDMDSKLKLHILPYFQDFKVIQISPKIILQWQNQLEKYSYKYKNNLRTYLFGMLKYAEKYYKIPNQLNFVDRFRNNSEETKEMSIWSEDEFNKFINCIERLDYKAYFSALYLTGCRKGELLATTWEDWNLEDNILNINKNVTRKVYGKSWTITTPKNITSIRKIAIPNSLSELMKNYKEWQKLNKAGQDFVFGSNAPFADSNIDRFFKEKCNESGVIKIRIHDFRHSHASFLIGHGASIVAVAKRLGHKNIEQTLNTYSHLIQNEEERLITMLNNVKI